MSSNHYGRTRVSTPFLVCLAMAILCSAFPGCDKPSSASQTTSNESQPDPIPTETNPLTVLPHASSNVLATARPELLQPAQDDGFFDQKRISSFRIRISADAWRQLETDPRAFVHADVQVDNITYSDIGLHLKGRNGSFRWLDRKPGFTLKFNKFKKGQRFHGMEKVHLNNAVQDSSFMTEIICGRMFRAAGVPAARAANAVVQLNDRKLGVYVLVEGITEDFLRQYFEKTDGNLYDFPYTHDITSSAAKESKDRPASDLRALAAAAKEPDHDRRWQRLGEVLDVERFITYLAMEVMIWDWDCYAMCRNNYRLYHDPSSDRITFMPHGMDQIFDNPRGSILPVMKGLVAKSVLETRQGRQLYFEQMRLLADRYFTDQQMTSQVDDLQNTIRPVLESLNPNAAIRHDQAVARLLKRIRQRIQSVQEQLKDPPLEPVRSSHFP